MSEQTDTIEAVAQSLASADGCNEWQLLSPGQQNAYVVRARKAIAAHTKALVEQAGELERWEWRLDYDMEPSPNGEWVCYDQAAATIAAQKAEIERLAEREAQARIEGGHAGIGEAARWLDGERYHFLSPRMIDALNPAAIAKGV